MSFAAATTGLVTAAVLLPAIVLLHLLHRQQRLETVPSTYLWQRLSQRLARRSYWRRLLTSLLFWLQILSACLLAFALAQPSWRSQSSAPAPVWQIILDESASLQAREQDGQMRLALAHHLLDQLAQQSPPGVRWQILAAAARPELIATGLNPRQTSAPSLWRTRPASNGPADWLATMRLAAAVRPPATEQVVLVTDGALPSPVLPGLAHETRMPLRIELARQAPDAPTPNIGITRFDLSPVGDSVGQYRALITLFNSGSDAAAYVLTWQVNGQPLPSAPPAQGQIPAGGEISLLVPLAFLPGVVVSAHLSPVGAPDLLALDNQAYRVTLPLRRAHLLLISPGNPALVHGLSIFPYVDLTVVPAAPPSPTAAAGYDLLLFDRIAPTYVPPVPWVAWGLPAKALMAALVPLQAGFWSEWVAGHPTLAVSPTRPVTVDWDEEHPLSRYVPWDQIRVSSAWPLPSLVGGLTLWQSQTGPLAQVGAEPPGYLIFAFDLTQTDWPYHYSFPVWVKNLLDWALPWAAAAVGPSLTVGQPVPARSVPSRLFMSPADAKASPSPSFAAARAAAAGPPPSATNLLIVGPQGYRQHLSTRPATLAATMSGAPAALWFPPRQAPLGGYWLQQDGQVVSGWSVNLLSREESDLRLTLTATTTSPTGQTVPNRPGPQETGPAQALVSPTSTPTATGQATASAAPSSPLLRPLQEPALIALFLALVAEAALFIRESRPVRPRHSLPSSRWWPGKGAVR